MQSPYLKRALYIAEGLSVDAVGIDADKHYIHDDNTRRGEAREVLARIKAFGEVLIHRRPKFLGETIPITGDGRLTLDHAKP